MNYDMNRLPAVREFYSGYRRWAKEPYVMPRLDNKRDALNQCISDKLNVEKQTHSVKCDPFPFLAIIQGSKPFEIRQNDRDYRVGDEIVVMEWKNDAYTGRSVSGTIGYMIQGEYGLPADVAVMAVEWDLENDSERHA